MFKYLFAILVLAPVAAFAADTRSDYDRDFNLSTIKTFRFASKTVSGNELNDKRMRNAITESFGRVGVTKTEADADVIIAYYATAEQKTKLHTTAVGPAWRLPQSAWTEDYVEGSAILDVIDAQSLQLIWRGRVTGTITLNSADAKIKTGMDSLAKAFRKDRERQAR